MNAPTNQAIKLRRVRRGEVAHPAFGQPDPYARLMACWADFMQVDERDLGSRGMKLIGDSKRDIDVHEAQRLADLKVGEAVNAMVDSLTTVQRWSIYKSQRLVNVWRFNNANYETVLTDARNSLEEKLRKNIATKIYFL